MKIITKIVKGFFTWLRDAGMEVIAQAFTLLVDITELIILDTRITGIITS